MKASKNSLHARLYDFTYNSSLPRNLCPYFWKLVLALIVLIPNFILQLPILIINFFIHEERQIAESSAKRAAGTFVYFGLKQCLIVIHMISLLQTSDGLLIV